ncbi:MAG TPA: pitrilysin family protein [Holophaga sp.]|nr:pitrilysin family protein [Holophaga sp.]
MRRPPAMGTLLALIVSAASLGAQAIPVKEHVLKNGLRVLLVERPGQATIGTAWAAHAGSANERPGITGAAHLLEHMMFKGSQVIGTTDIAKDRELDAKQDALYAEITKELDLLRVKQLRGEIADLHDPKVRSPRHQQLVEELAKAVKAQQDLLRKGEFDVAYTEIGAPNTNAFTSNDVTAYILTIPANRLEFWAWMESDRLNTPVFREFYAERDVVNDERRLSEARPTGRFEEAFQSVVWQAHPYSWPVVGWGSDISTITRAELTDFFKRNYAPNNVTLSLVGGFKASEVLPLLERYFGRIPANPAGAPVVKTLEPKQVAPTRMVAEADTPPSARIVWKTVAQAHKDQCALDLLGRVLSGASGRLNKALVLDQKVALGVGGFHRPQKFGGTFTVAGMASQGQSPENVEKALLQEVERIQKEGITEEELQKAKNQAIAGLYRGQGDNLELATALAQADAISGYRSLLDLPARTNAVTREDVQRVAQAYLTPEGRNTLLYLRKAKKEAQ